MPNFVRTEQPSLWDWALLHQMTHDIAVCGLEFCTELHASTRHGIGHHINFLARPLCVICLPSIWHFFIPRIDKPNWLYLQLRLAWPTSTYGIGPCSIRRSPILPHVGWVLYNTGCINPILVTWSIFFYDLSWSTAFPWIGIFLIWAWVLYRTVLINPTSCRSPHQLSSTIFPRHQLSLTMTFLNSRNR